jgi:hypothetical protein
MLLPSHLSNTLSCCILLCLSSIYFAHSCYLLAETNYYYITQGLVPILSVEAIHQLHIFIFVLAVSHVVLSAVTVLLGIAQTRKWQHWENKIQASDENGMMKEHSPLGK